MKTQVTSSSESHKYLIPPIFRFLTEFTTWSWFILAAFTKNLIYITGLILSIGLLAFFNTPGDKAKDGPVNVPGYLRIVIEIFSGFLGIFGAWILFGVFGLLLQGGLTILTFILDAERWAWFLGIREHPPESVSRLLK
ncbi:MAG: hypothetical protein ACFFFH_12210 [Candidatus Thorarchaeota archaeon]